MPSWPWWRPSVASIGAPGPGEPLRARIGSHVGEALAVDDDYFGPTLNRAARVMSAGWGGQTLCTSVIVELARDRCGGGHHVPESG